MWFQRPTLLSEAYSHHNTIQLRKDYRELVVLTIIYLGGKPPEGISTTIMAQNVPLFLVDG